MPSVGDDCARARRETSECINRTGVQRNEKRVEPIHGKASNALLKRCCTKESPGPCSGEEHKDAISDSIDGSSCSNERNSGFFGRGKSTRNEEKIAADVLAKLPSRLVGQVQVSCPMFATAGTGTEITVSEDALEKAGSLLRKSDDEGSTVVKLQSASVGQDQISCPMFVTAGKGTEVSVSEEALEKADILLCKSYDEGSAVAKAHSISVGQDRVSCPMFVTAGKGTEISVSEEALEKASRLFRKSSDEDPTTMIGSKVGDEQSCTSGCRGASTTMSAFKTASKGIAIELTDESLARSGKLLESFEKEATTSAIGEKTKEKVAVGTFLLPTIAEAGNEKELRVSGKGVSKPGHLPQPSTRGNRDCRCDLDVSEAQPSPAFVSNQDAADSCVAAPAFATAESGAPIAVSDESRAEANILISDLNDTAESMSRDRDIHVEFSERCGDLGDDAVYQPNTKQSPVHGEGIGRKRGNVANCIQNKPARSIDSPEGSYSPAKTTVHSSHNAGGVEYGTLSGSTESDLSMTKEHEKITCSMDHDAASTSNLPPVVGDTSTVHGMTAAVQKISENDLKVGDGVKKRVIRNPYAKKPMSLAAGTDGKAQPILATPIPGKRPRTAGGSVPSLTPLAKPCVKSALRSNAVQSNGCSSGGLDSTAGVGVANSFAQSSVPYHERLPSRTVTFTSAEILTVTELSHHLEFYANRSVRITGVLLHHDVAGKFILLGDPLAGSRPRHGSSCDRSVAKNPYQKQRGVTPLRNPAQSRTATSKLNSSGSPKKHPLLGSNGRKRRLVNNGGAGLGSLSSGVTPRRSLLGARPNPVATPASTRGTTTKRQRLTPLPFAAATEAIRRQKRKDAPVVAVDVTCTTSMLFESGDDYDMAASVGDLVMVIGEIRRAPPTGSSERKFDSCSDVEHTVSMVSAGLRHVSSILTKQNKENGIKQGVRVLFEEDAGVGENASVEDPDRDKNDKQANELAGGFFLSSRIARNANGTDMNLQLEALLLRRKHMLERMGDACGASAGYVIGCGPPAGNSK